MSATAHTLTTSLARPVAGSGLLRRLLAHIVRRRAIQVRRRLLNQLPDHVLKDIGLNRCNIDHVVAALVDGREDPMRRRGFYGS